MLQQGWGGENGPPGWDSPVYVVSFQKLPVLKELEEKSLLGIKEEACTFASQSNHPIKIWTDIESSLHSISSLKTNNPLAQDIQKHHSQLSRLGFIKVHVVHTSNEAADLRATKTTLEGIPVQYPASRSYLKTKLHAISTQLWQNEWDNGDIWWNIHSILPKVKTSPASWKIPEIMFATGHDHSQLTLRELASKRLIAVVVASWEALPTSQPAAPLQALFVLPSPQTTWNISGGKESSTTHCQELR
ncbi:hypothetical protein AVEN_50533-1 [Araneus ventricosus]|uniref:RNase H type-1 domain-containing protein n=1 Tax=Araneus ventricosus TaxID=182803 RepID=A0A4Y2AQB5_ARAVE|nr:hypothetical protein AVEN_50533-1 [Araneus ventricosus]